MTTPEITLTLLAGAGIALAYVRLVEAIARREQRPDATTPAKPHNALQEAVYGHDDGPSLAEHVAAEMPRKRGPGRPRKTPETPARIVGGKQFTRSYVVPEPDAKKRERRKVN